MIFMISCTTFSQIKHKIYGLGISAFGALDIDDSTYHVINPYININYTSSNSNTFDSENLRYIYKKDGLQNPDTIIVLDAESGSIMQKITVEDNTMSRLEYDKYTNRVYGLGISAFGALDLDDSTYHVINPIINVNYAQYNTFDSENSRYIYKKDGLQNPDTIIVLDAESGSIIQKITVEDNTMSRLEYDKYTNRVYGLGISAFGALDLDDSTYHVINPDININYTQDNTFDSENSRYIYKKDGLQNPDTIIVLDAESGNIIQKITVEDNTMSRLEYCSYRFGNIINYGYSKTLALYPNPTYDIINVKTSDFIGSSLIVYNLTGKRLINTKIISYNTKVDLKNNPKGVYIISVEKNNMKYSSLMIKK